MGIENLAKKAKELKAKGMTSREICQEMHLSNPTVKWLLAKKPEGGIPADVKTGWRSIGVSGARISSISEILLELPGRRHHRYGQGPRWLGGPHLRVRRC